MSNHSDHMLRMNCNLSWSQFSHWQLFKKAGTETPRTKIASGRKERIAPAGSSLWGCRRNKESNG
jgi:hypothetical protein